MIEHAAHFEFRLDGTPANVDQSRGYWLRWSCVHCNCRHVTIIRTTDFRLYCSAVRQTLAAVRAARLAAASLQESSVA